MHCVDSSSLRVRISKEVTLVVVLVVKLMEATSIEEKTRSTAKSG